MKPTLLVICLLPIAALAQIVKTTTVDLDWHKITSQKICVRRHLKIK